MQEETGDESPEKWIRFRAETGVCLDELPLDLIMLIFRKLDWPTLRRLRSANSTMCSFYTQYALHCYRRAMLSDDILPYQRTLCEMMRITFNLYMFSEFESLVAASISLFCEFHSDRFPPKVVLWRRVVMHFHMHTERQIPVRANAQQVRLYYMLSLLNILKKFRTYNLVCCRRMVAHWQIAIELRGIFLGMLPVEGSLTNGDSLMRANLMAILCELLYLNLLERREAHLWNCGYLHYIFGNDFPKRRGSNCLQLHFTVHGEESFVESICRQAELSDEPVTIPKDTSSIPLLINMDCMCKSALNAGYRELGKVEICPVVFVE